MKNLLLVVVAILAFTFESNAQDTPRANKFEISLGGATPMSDFGNGANAGVAFRAGTFIPSTNTGNVNLCVGGMYIKNPSQVEGASNTIKVFEFGLDILVNPQVRLKALALGGLYSFDIDLGGDLGELSESAGGVGYDIRLEFLLDEHIFLCMNYLNLNLDKYSDFGIGVFGISMGAKF